jgi:hypothetical protein
MGWYQGEYHLIQPFEVISNIGASQLHLEVTPLSSRLYMYAIPHRPHPHYVGLLIICYSYG